VHAAGIDEVDSVTPQIRKDIDGGRRFNRGAVLDPCRRVVVGGIHGQRTRDVGSQTDRGTGGVGRQLVRQVAHTNRLE